MKRILALLLVCVTCFLCSCDFNAFDEIVAKAEVATNERGKNSFVLPISKEYVELDEEYEKYLPYVTVELLRDAEEKINESAGDNEGSGFYIGIDKEGYLILQKEVIEMLPPEERNENVGCGDHKHRFYSERISTQALEYVDPNDPANWKDGFTIETFSKKILRESSPPLHEIEVADGEIPPKDALRRANEDVEGTETMFDLSRRTDAIVSVYKIGSDTANVIVMTPETMFVFSTERVTEIEHVAYAAHRAKIMSVSVISNEEYKRCRAVYDQLLKIEGATDTNIDPSATKLISFMSPDGVVSFTPETITSLLSYDALQVFNEVYRRYGIDHLAR